MTEAETAWLAGIIEGEGCLDLHGPHGHGRRPKLRVRVEMRDLDIVRRAGALMGTYSPWRRPPRNEASETFTACVTSAKAERVMQAILPYMGERRSAKINELLSTPNLSHQPKAAQ